MEAFPMMSQGMSDVRDSLDDEGITADLNRRCEGSSTCVIIVLNF